jgi:TatD DNase family protein
MPLIDAHCHSETAQFVRYLKRQRVYATLNCGTPAEFEQNQHWVEKAPHIQLSAGIHPWQADQLTFAEMQPILDQVGIIGEIGLDNVWTKVPLTQQQPIFTQQLAYAEKQHKPVIIHTKGPNELTLQTMRAYFNTYLIHWYDDLTGLKQLLDLGCYFSIGPSFSQAAAIQTLIQKVPLTQVLIESDGLGGMSWALNQELTLKAYTERLQAVTQVLAQRHHLSVPVMQKQLIQNLTRFWQGQPGNEGD